MVETWGANLYGECNRPATLTNAAAIAAGLYQSIAINNSGIISQWGEYFDCTNTWYPVTDNHTIYTPGVNAFIGRGWC